MPERVPERVSCARARALTAAWPFSLAGESCDSDAGIVTTACVSWNRPGPVSIELKKREAQACTIESNG